MPPKDDPMVVGIDEGITRYDAAEEAALTRFEEKGFVLRTKLPLLRDNTTYDGRLPRNLGAMKPLDIAEYYGLQVEYTDYVTGQVILARAERDSAKDKLELVYAAVRRSKLGTAEGKSDLAVLDTRYVDANAEYMEAKTYYDLLSAVLESATRDLRYVSRIIETSKMDMMMRGRGESAGRISEPAGDRGAARFTRRRRE